MTGSAVVKKNKLSRRKKSRAKKTLYKAFAGILEEIDSDQFLRSHLFLSRPDKDKLVIGGYIVTKTDNGYYNVYKKNLKNLLYRDLYSFDAAMAIAESLNAGHEKRVEQIIKIEEEYVKYTNDMDIYRYRHNEVIKLCPEDAWIFEDRYMIASNKARNCLKELRQFRIVKV